MIKRIIKRYLRSYCGVCRNCHGWGYDPDDGMICTVCLGSGIEDS